MSDLIKVRVQWIKYLTDTNVVPYFFVSFPVSSPSPRGYLTIPHSVFVCNNVFCIFVYSVINLLASFFILFLKLYVFNAGNKTYYVATTLKNGKL